MSNSSEFAMKYRSFLDSRKRDEARREELDSARRAQLREACERLRSELCEFARELGHIDVEAGPNSVVYRQGDHSLVFHVGDGPTAHVRFGYPESRQLELNYTMREGWRLAVPQAESVPFFDEGLYALLVAGLGLPAMPGGPGATERPFAVLLDDEDIAVVDREG